MTGITNNTARIAVNVAVALLLLGTSLSARALVNANGSSFNQGELEGYIGVSGGCSSLLLTNSWVLTAAHCYKPKSDPKEKWTLKFATADQKSSERDIDPANNFTHQDLDVRIFKLTRPVEINGSTSGYIHRMRKPSTLPTSLIGADLSEIKLGERYSPITFMELGSGGHEDKGSKDTRFRECRETTYLGNTGSNAIANYIKVDHDTYGGAFPLADPNNIGCEYLGGDSGSPIIYRNATDGEWRVVATCPGIGEGWCISADAWYDFVLDKVWSDVEPVGLSLTRTRVRKDATLEIRLEDLELATRPGLLVLAPRSCGSQSKCTPVAQKLVQRGSTTRSVNLKLPSSGIDAGRYQLRYYVRQPFGDADLKRLIGVQIGGSLALSDSETRTFRESFFSVIGGTDNEPLTAYLVPDGKQPDRYASLSKTELKKLAKNSVSNWPIGGSGSSTSGLNESYQSRRYYPNGRMVKPNDTLHLVLVENATRKVIDQDFLKILGLPVNLTFPFGFNVNDGLRFAVDGGLEPFQTVRVTLTSGSRTVEFDKVEPERNRLWMPAYYLISPDELASKGVKNGKWKVEVTRPSGISQVKIDALSANRKPVSENEVFLYSSTLSADFEHRSRLDGFGRLTNLDLETLYKPEGNKAGITFSLWTGMPGKRLAEATCSLTGGPVYRCENKISMDIANLFGNDRSQCFHLRAQYVQDKDTNSSDPLNRRSESVSYPTVLGERWICGVGRRPSGWR